jgi:twitching motility protein PilT
MLSINEMLVIANQMHASDLHLSVGVPPKVRVFGDLVDIEGCSILTPADTAELGYSIIPPQLVQRFEEQGELDFSYAIMGEGRYRANVFHQRGSVAAVLRLIGMDIPSPSQLGIPNAVVDLTFKKRGLVLVTGPTGSGKSTTLASLINVINDRSPYHVITLEDPIEYLHPHKRCIVNQREIGLDTKSFSQALTSTA